MSYKSFYRYIYKENIRGKEKYMIRKNGELFMDCYTLEEALYERDRLENAEWDWDNYVQMPDTINGYIHIDLPPFEKKSTHIYEVPEQWVVRGKGKRQKYYGTYYDYSEAKNVAGIYGANISHKRKAYRVQKTIDGKTISFGRYNTYDDAEKRVVELVNNNWRE